MPMPTFSIYGYDLRPLRDELVIVVTVNGETIRTTSVLAPKTTEFDLLNDADVLAINQSLFPEDYKQ